VLPNIAQALFIQLLGLDGIIDYLETDMTDDFRRRWRSSEKCETDLPTGRFCSKLVEEVIGL